MTFHHDSPAVFDPPSPPLILIPPPTTGYASYMSGEIHNPHDKFFKTWFSRPENLIPFLETALPADIFALLDVSTLAISDGTFIDEEHREHFSDLSASIQLQGREARLYILVEHKSYADKWALLQILRYMVQTWTRDARTEAAVPLLPFGR